MAKALNIVLTFIIFLAALAILDFSVNKGEIFTGFIGYAGDANGNLTIWDDSDSATIYRFQTIVFYANFTNATGQPISDLEGNVTINNLEGFSYAMTFNSTSGLWYYSTIFSSFTSNGTFEYNVTANSSVYALDLTAIDNYTIYPVFTYLIPSDYPTVEACFDAINNTPYVCKMNSTDNYYENFSTPNKKYSFFGFWTNAPSLYFGDILKNVTIDFNNASISKNNQVFIYANENYLGPSYNNFTFNNFNYESAGDNSYGLLADGGSDTVTIENVSIISKLYTVREFAGNFVMKNAFLYAPSAEGLHDLEGDAYIYNSSLIGGTVLRQGGSTGNIIARGSFFNDTFLDIAASTLNLDIRNSEFNFSAISIHDVGISENVSIVNNSFNKGADGANCIDLSSPQGGSDVIENNTFNNCASGVEYNVTWRIADSMYRYGGNNFNETTTPVLANVDTSQLIPIVQNGTDVSSLATGNNNFSLWLVDVPGAGAPFATLYVEEPNALTCADLATAFGGTCYLDEQDYLQANGPDQNYSVKNVSGLSIIQGNSRMFLNHVNLTFYANSSISVNYARNLQANISGNIFRNSTSITVKRGEANIWMNIFLDYPPIVDGIANASLCVKSKGNFYEKSLSVPSGDCGQVNLTSGSFTDSIGFRRQSSPVQPVHYDIFNNASGTLNFVESISSSSSLLSFNWPFDSGTYNIAILPWIEGSRINGTVFSGAFTFSKTSTPPGGGTGGGGGGGGIVSAPSNVSGNKLLTPGSPAVTQSLFVLQVYKYTTKLNGLEHKIVLLQILNGTQAVLEFSSNPINITFSQGETRKVDINGDGSEFIQVTMLQISQQSVTLNVSNAQPSAPAEEIAATPKANLPVEEKPAVPAVQPAQQIAPSKPNWMVPLFSAIAAIAVIAALTIYFRYFKKPGPPTKG